MRPRAENRDVLKLRRCHTKPVGLDRPKDQNCKEGRYSIGYAAKSPRTQDDLIIAGKQRQKAKRKELSQPLRKSARQQALYNLKRAKLVLPQEQTSLSLNPHKPTRCSSRDNVALPQAEQEAFGNQAQTSPNPETHTWKLTSSNLHCLRRNTKSRPPSSTGRTDLQQWEFINMTKQNLKKQKSEKTESESGVSRETSSTIKTISTTNPKFRRLAVRNGILCQINSSKTSVFDDIRISLKRKRGSASPEPETYERYCTETRVAASESDIQEAVLPLLKKYHGEPYKRAHNLQFTNFPIGIGFNDGLSAAIPDYTEGYLEEAFEPHPVSDLLGGSAIPVASEYPIALGHLAGEFKMLGGDFACGTTQAAYDAACLVYGRNQACISIGEIDRLSTAYVGSFVCDGCRLLISVHYSTKNSLGKTVYHQCPIFDANIRIDYESFKDGYRLLRNLQDWTKQNAYWIKDKLIAHCQLSRTETEEQIIPDGSRTGNHPEDFLGTDFEIIEN